MFTSHIGIGDIGDYLNPALFEPRLLTWKRSLAAKHQGTVIDSLAKCVPGFAFPSEAFGLSEPGEPVVRIGDLNDGILDRSSCTWISKSFAAASRYRAIDEICLFAATGATVGKVGYKNLGVPVWVNQRVFALSARPSHDIGFIFACLQLPFVRQQVVAFASGAAQPNISDSQLLSCCVPVFSEITQKYIGDKVRQAERLKKRSQQIDDSLRLIYESSIPVSRRTASTERVWRPRGTVLDAIRLDPKYYAPEYLYVAESTASRAFVDLDQMVDNIRYGASVEADYVKRGEGLPFVRGTDLIPNRICFTESVDISPRLREAIGDNILQEGQILITRSGTVGVAAVVTPEVAGAAYGSFMMSMRPRNGIDPYFLAWFLNSWVGANQIHRRENGAIQLNVNIQELSSVRIWQASDDVQREVAHLVRRWHLIQDSAERLVKAANMLVEELIEGNITEDELTNAQLAVEKGDRSVDCEMLSRLSISGIDCTGKPPLFPDMDALNSVLEEAEHTEHRNGDPT